MMYKTVSIRPDLRRLALFGSTLLVAGALLLGGQARAQALDTGALTLDPQALEELVAPIALYPDDVLGIVLAASTFPLEIVQAARFLDDLEVDPDLEPDEDWDESIIALLNYPEIVYLMNDDLDWTWNLGEAVLTDETAVLAAAQSFRSRALAAGNLVTDDRQIVSVDEEVIEIAPADPEVVYIPVYEPREVVVYHSEPIYRYYPVAYPVYYYPYPTGYYFPHDHFWGVTSYFSIGWHTHHLHVHHHSHRLHPYYAHSFYYGPHYYRSNVILTFSFNDYDNVWRPSPRRGVRPRTRTVESQPGLSTRGVSTTTTAGTAVRGATTRTRTETRTSITGTRRADADAGNAATRTRANTTTAAATRRSEAAASAATRRAGESADAATRTRGATGTVIGGRVGSSTEGSAPTRTRTVPSTSTSPSQIRGIRSGDGQGSTGQPTRSPSTAPRTSSGTRTVAPAPRTSTRTSTSTMRRAAPAATAPRARAPVTRAAPAPSTRFSAPSARSAPAPSVRSAPAPGARSAPAPRAAPAPAGRTRQPR